MFLQAIKSEGIAHISYILGDGGKAAVIDPRRDCDIYIDTAYREGCRISYIFETHRNEDYAIGSVPLAGKTGAEVFHGRALPFAYGSPADGGDEFSLGGLKLRILETPGHTYESISIALYDTAFGENAVGVFTGDALFIGDVGRTDFFPDAAEETAGLLYDSIHKRILPLGDQAILYPAHGAGSVCGSGMADRDFSTLGYERACNPRLQLKRDEFVKRKVSEQHYLPPYFKKREEYNLNGPPLTPGPVLPPPVEAAEIEAAQAKGAQLVDIRSPEAFAGAFVPGSLALPCSMIPVYAGWFLDYERPIYLLPPEDGYETLRQACTHLYRIGYDNIEGFLSGGMFAWETDGRPYDHIPTIYSADLIKELQKGSDLTVVDVRKKEEWDEDHLEEAHHIYLGHLPDKIDGLDRDKTVVTLCGSGRRAIIAASLLRSRSFEKVMDALGAMQAVG